MKPVSFILAALLFTGLLTGCDNSTDASEDYMRPSFRNLAEGDTIRDSVFTIIVDAEQNCGCSSYIDFYIDDTLLFQDYIREFSYRLETAEWQGYRTIKAHGVVPSSSSATGMKADGWDSVHVVIDLTQ